MMKILLTALTTIIGTTSAQNLTFTAIPDQLESTLLARANAVTDLLENYISDKCNVEVNVVYNPVTNYQDAVDALLDEVADFGWYGGLTGVQAGLRSPPAVYLTQRIEDTEFTSVFISDADMELTSIDGVEGKSLAFGSASSTSGHLMPQYYLTEADVTPSSSIFTGSHDATIDAVMNGTTQTGALNSVVWFNRLAANTTGNTSVFYTTPQFVDYLWVAGAGITDKWASIEGDPSSVPGCEDINALITEAFLSATNETAIGQALFAAYSTVGYVAITKGEYDPIEETGCQLDMIEKQYCDEPIPENLGNVGSDNSTTSAEPEDEDETEYFDPEDGTEDIEFTDPSPVSGDVNATVTPVPDDDSVSSGITAKDFSAVLFSVSTIVATTFF